MNCRHCQTPLEQTFLDLGHAPPSNAYLSEQMLYAPEQYFPLKLKVCTNCWLVQTEDYSRAEELFNHEYAYFSSTSTSWLKHAAHYARMIIARLGLHDKSLVIEIASNDGYLLKNFVETGIPCLGIEPTASTAEVAEKLGIPVLREFFGVEIAEMLANERKQADLIIGNNVLAHVPDINNFTSGLKKILKEKGTITLEFPHLMRLIDGLLFDTVYHEHFSYLSLFTVKRILAEAGLRIWDVEELSTHGGSLRVYACHLKDARETTESVRQVLNKEDKFGISQLASYLGFQEKAERIKNDLIAFLLSQKKEGKKVMAYGAAAKGNTLLNFAGVKPDLLPYVCDAALSKQGKFMPGSHIPIVSPAKLLELKPDIVLILPWNIADEVIHQYAYIREWGGRFMTAVPQLQYL